MRYVCDNCGSTFYEPETIVPTGTNEMLDCCPLCNSVCISKDKEYNDSCKDIVAFMNNIGELTEKLIDINNKAYKKIDSDYVIKFDDLIADMEEIINISKDIKESLERY